MPRSPDSLRWRLREATAAAHARVDASAGSAFTTLAAYGAFLRSMHAFLRHARAALGADGAWLDEHVEALAADLDDLGAAPEPLEPRIAGVTGPAALGWRYVVAGSALGARVLVRRALALGVDAHRGARYLTLAATGEPWARLLADLEAGPVDPHVEAAACAAALDAFAAAEAAFLHVTPQPVRA